MLMRIAYRTPFIQLSTAAIYGIEQLLRALLPRYPFPFRDRTGTGQLLANAKLINDGTKIRSAIRIKKFGKVSSHFAEDGDVAGDRREAPLEPFNQRETKSFNK
jgi:hypothetical protein